MSKQDEAFEAWLHRNNANDPHERLDEPTLLIAKSAFAAGREAERERTLTAVVNTRLLAPGNDSPYQLGFLDACTEITRRIKEQDNDAR